MLYNKNGITITVSPDGRNYMVEGAFPISYHSTLDKAVLKVAKHEADRSGDLDLWIWLGMYEEVTFRATSILSHFPSEVTYDPSEENKCLVDPITGYEAMPHDASLNQEEN